MLTVEAWEKLIIEAIDSADVATMNCNSILLECIAWRVKQLKSSESFSEKELVDYAKVVARSIEATRATERANRNVYNIMGIEVEKCGE